MLYKRVVEGGTLSEPDGVPDPQFALPSTINWMRALAMLVSSNGLDFAKSDHAFRATTKRTLSHHAENTILEQLFFSLHQLSALEAMRGVARRSDVARVAIVAWYYGVYYAASAMVAAQDGSFQHDHTGTANTWDRQFAARSLALPPFALRVSTLVEKKAKDEVKLLRGNSSHDLRTVPSTPSDALGACCSYLSGTTNWYRWRTTEDLRDAKDFKALGVKDFRTKPAQQLRDGRLDRKTVSFLHQAIRYRGKANYREALFLGYGAQTETLLQGYIDDLASVLSAFVAMAGAFSARRLGKPLWQEFLDDVEKRRAFSTSPMSIWN